MESKPDGCPLAGDPNAPALSIRPAGLNLVVRLSPSPGHWDQRCQILSPSLFSLFSPSFLPVVLEMCRLLGYLITQTPDSPVELFKAQRLSLSKKKKKSMTMKVVLLVNVIFLI